MGVSKQDWKDWHANVWPASQSAYAKLIAMFDDVDGLIDGGDGDGFADCLETGGPFQTQVAAVATEAATALRTIERLKLEGNQRRFANRSAISTSDDAVNKVKALRLGLDDFQSGLFRGRVSATVDALKAGSSKIADVADMLKGQFRSGRYVVQKSFEDADAAASALAAIDKIGVV